jgi:phosphate transport system protein
VEIPQPLRREFRSQMAGVEDRLLAQGATVLEQLDEAVGALAQRDAERAAAVLRARERLEAEHRALQEDILRLLTLQAPVAGQLRQVATYIPVNLHVARMGGLCRNVARAAQEPRGPEDDQIQAQIGEMAQLARRVAERSLECFARRDLELARSLPGLDEPVDVLNRSIFRRTVELAAAEGDFEWVVRMVLVARYIERLSDHAVEIGEQVAYAVTGRMDPLAASP